MLALATITLALLGGSVGAKDFPNSRVVPDVCNGTYACALTDSKWPTSTSFTCGKTRVSAYSLNVATDSGILIGAGSAVEASATPCEDTSSTDLSYMKYDHGRYAVYYTIATTCNCGTDARANCTAATTLDDASCNVATFSFCGVEAGSTACTAA